MRSVVFSNDKRQKPFIKGLLESGVKPRALFTQTPFTSTQIAFHRFTKGYFLSRSVKKKWPTFYHGIRNGLNVFNYAKEKNSACIDLLKKWEIDYAFVFIFGIIDKATLDAVNNDFINFHTSYLPNNRGASPTNWVIRNRSAETGYTIHLLNEKIDAGAILHQTKVHLTGEETTQILNSYLMDLGSRAMIQIFYQLKLGQGIESIENKLADGSYEKPFSKRLNYFSEQNTRDEIFGIINSSNGETYTALYSKDNVEYPVKDAIEIRGERTMDSERYIVTKDGVTLYLIFKRDAV